MNAKFEMTPRQRKMADRHNLSRATVKYRVLVKGETVDQAVSYPPAGRERLVINGHKLTRSQIDAAEDNGVEWLTLKGRLYAGWTVEDAISTPIMDVNQKSRRSNRTKHHIIQEVGRIKYMQTVMDDPPPITKRMRKELMKLGKKVEDIKAIEVDLSDLEVRA